MTGAEERSVGVERGYYGFLAMQFLCYVRMKGERSGV